MIPGTSQSPTPARFSVNWYGGAIPTHGNRISVAEIEQRLDRPDYAHVVQSLGERGEHSVARIAVDLAGPLRVSIAEAVVSSGDDLLPNVVRWHGVDDRINPQPARHRRQRAP